MKNTTLVTMALLAISLGSPAIYAQSGADYNLGWNNIGGGGVTSTGGVYALSGTIGQPEVNAATGGGFTLRGGFWPGIDRRDPIPHLRVELSGTDVILAWPNPSTGFQLQEAVNLGGVGTAWSLVGQSPAIVGSEKQVRLPATGFGRMFRLHKPAP